MIKISSSGNFDRTDSFLKRAFSNDIRSVLHAQGRSGVAALAGATPVDSGLTAASWGYEISVARGSSSITWTNTHHAGGSPVAILLQYGHGTGTGGYVSGRDYINPAIAPIFDQISDTVWKAVTAR